MNIARIVCCWIVFSFSILSVVDAFADEVTYTLENVRLEEGAQQMFGTFTWTYSSDDFENGVGQFTFLDIPFTSHDHTDLEASFDVGNSIEITLPGSSHDDGVDITLFLMQPLTPTTSSYVDLERSRYEIGGNGFHDGYFLSGEIVPSSTVDVEDEHITVTARGALSSYPNPFNPRTTLTYTMTRPGEVKLSIHDVHGRRVATLLDGVFRNTGEYSYLWSGLDSKGDEIRSGIYFARLETGSHTATRKMTLLK